MPHVSGIVAIAWFRLLPIAPQTRPVLFVASKSLSQLYILSVVGFPDSIRRRQGWWQLGRLSDFATEFSTPTTSLCWALASTLGLAGQSTSTRSRA